MDEEATAALQASENIDVRPCFIRKVINLTGSNYKSCPLLKTMKQFDNIGLVDVSQRKRGAEMESMLLD